MKKITWLLIFVSSSLVAQNRTLKGTLLDKITNEPVVYANISFLNIKKGFISSLQSTVAPSKLGLNVTEVSTYINYKYVVKKYAAVRI